MLRQGYCEQVHDTALLFKVRIQITNSSSHEYRTLGYSAFNYTLFRNMLLKYKKKLNKPLNNINNN